MYGTTETQSDDIIDNWDGPVSLEPGDNLYKLLQVVGSENRRLDLELESLYDNRFVDTATGRELEKLGRYVGVTRKTDEKDDKLRIRINAAFASQASDTTRDSFATVALVVLDADAESVSFSSPPETEPKTVELTVDGSIIDASPLTIDEIQVLLNGALSVDAQAVIISGGGFAFAGDDASLEGFNEGTWSSTVN